MITDLKKTPFPYFGGKADAAPVVWHALGDVDHYVEPFAGSLAVLMRRPHEPNRTYYSETVNDIDGLLINAWRAMSASPDALAEAASWPVSEADLHARHLAVLKWKNDRELEHLMGDPDFHDVRIAGWWIWGMSCWIGSGWCVGVGPWVIGEGGRIEKRSGSAGVSRKIPHLTGNGRGANGLGTREPGVSRKIPNISDDGKGANHPGTREPGVSRKIPHLTSDGRGANRPCTREPGVEGDDEEFHPLTMPELRRWFAFLSARLRHVRILNGDWQRAVTNGAMQTLPVRQGGHCGIFVDPPYADTADRDDNLYAHDSLDVAHGVREWALRSGGDPRLRIVVAGFDGEHGSAFAAAGWREVEWFKAGFLKGGMAQTNRGEGCEVTHQQGRERLWMSPHCLAPAKARQTDLFGAVAT